MATNPLDDPNDSSLIPPVGSLFGSTSYAAPPFQQAASWPDDSTIGGQTQLGSGSMTTYLYVYWVNGAAPYHYIVIQRLLGNFSPGAPLAKNTSSQGFFQYGLTLVNELLDANGNPFPAGGAIQPRVLSYAPLRFTATPANPNAPVPISVPMTLLYNQGGTLQPGQFTAEDSGQVLLADWGIDDPTTPAVAQQSSFFHQVSTWDPSVAAPRDWPKWYTKVFPTPDCTAVAPPATSTNALPFEIRVAWRVDLTGDQLNPPPATIMFASTLTQGLAAYHNYKGCKATYQTSGPGVLGKVSGGNHLQAIASPVRNTQTFDLAALIGKQAR